MIKCTDCYEENPGHFTRCSRCGRLLEPETYGSKRNVNQKNSSESAPSKFEVQHADAPNVMRTDRSVYRK